MCMTAAKKRVKPQQGLSCPQIFMASYQTSGIEKELVACCIEVAHVLCELAHGLGPLDLFSLIHVMQSMCVMHTLLSSYPRL